ncbi:late embryogenesis abundant protein At1g64065-like [Malania oleifera]|uniref:late embryogenesis abundant protein At1g64065-like n=1 Tax=Malania oleifera TaxID=397392 RepID=UPI0025ADD139|nr:late embryogenesis abundant protein At1g64065-like [Malania oleifera]
MAGYSQQAHPLPLGQPRSDQEEGIVQSKELQRRKSLKRVAYIVAFVVFQTAIILLFALVVMRIRAPKVKLSNLKIGDISITNTTGLPSFNMSFTTRITIKNTNFGNYKFEISNVTFTYKGILVGHAIIPKGQARFRSTKKIEVTADVNSNGVFNSLELRNDIESGILRLEGRAKLSGKVQLMMVMKKKKSTEMNCTMSIDLPSKIIRDLSCM